MIEKIKNCIVKINKSILSYADEREELIARIKHIDASLSRHIIEIETLDGLLDKSNSTVVKSSK